MPAMQRAFAKKVDTHDSGTEAPRPPGTRPNPTSAGTGPPAANPPPRRSWRIAIAVTAVLAYLITWQFASSNDIVKQITQGLHAGESPESPGGRRFTPSGLSKYKGENGGPVYIAILGQVFDVTHGRRHYEPGAGYSVFAGQDASRAFITGEFEGEAVTGDVSGLKPQEMKGLLEWRGFYHSTYVYKGYLPGSFIYDESGAPTAMLREVEAGKLEADRLDAIRKANEKKHPPCNTKWSAKTGGEVWCNEGHFPRLLTEHVDDGSRSALPMDGGSADRKTRTRCACFDTRGWSNMRQIYKGCKPDEQRCKIIKD